VPKLQKLCGLSIQVWSEKSREKLLEHEVTIHSSGEKSNSAEAKQVFLQLQLTFLLWLQATVSDTVTEYNRHFGDSLAKAPQLLEGILATQQLQEMLQIHLVARRNEKERAKNRQRYVG